MPGPKSLLVAVGLIASLVPAAPARAQFGFGAVAFQPIIGTVPDGVTLNVTPVVSADRRYVRMALQPQFIAFTRFDVFPVPAAVGGGGNGGGIGGIGGIGGGGIGGGGVGGGVRGANAAMGGQVDGNTFAMAPGDFAGSDLIAGPGGYEPRRSPQVSSKARSSKAKAKTTKRRRGH